MRKHIHTHMLSKVVFMALGELQILWIAFDIRIVRFVCLSLLFLINITICFARSRKSILGFLSDDFFPVNCLIQNFWYGLSK